MNDLILSPKFANHLSKLGMLDGLINTLKQYREKENYPFQLADKRIIRQVIFKSLCELYSGTGKKPTEKKFKEELEKWTNYIYGENTKTAGEIILEETKRGVEKPEEEEEKVPVINLESGTEIPF